MIHQVYYFEHRSIVEEILQTDNLCHDVLDSQDKVIFTEKSGHRDFPIPVQDTVFYVNRGVIHDRCPEMELILSRSEGKYNAFERVSKGDFLMLLKIICPYQYGIYSEPIRAENLPTLLYIARQFRFGSLLNRCKDFIRSHAIFDVPVKDLYELYMLVGKWNLDGNRKMRCHLLAAAIQEKNLKEVLELVIATKNAEWAAARIRIDGLKHDTKNNKSKSHSVSMLCGCEQKVTEVQSTRLFEVKGQQKKTNKTGAVCRLCQAFTCKTCVKTACPAAIDKLLDIFERSCNVAPPVQAPMPMHFPGPVMYMQPSAVPYFAYPPNFVPYQFVPYQIPQPVYYQPYPVPPQNAPAKNAHSSRSSESGYDSQECE